MVAWVYWLG